MSEEELEKFELKASLVTCTIKLTRDEGLAIKDLINEQYPHTFPHYALKVGVSTPNFYSTLNGERACSLDFLNKLLSGIGYQAIITNPEIIIQEIPQIEIISSTEHLIELENEHESCEMEMERTTDPYETTEEEIT